MENCYFYPYLQVSGIADHLSCCKWKILFSSF